MITTVVDQSRKDPKIVLKIEFNAYDPDHAREVDRVAAKLVEELVEVVGGQFALPINSTDIKTPPTQGPTQAEMDAEDANLREQIGATADA